MGLQEFIDDIKRYKDRLDDSANLDGFIAEVREKLGAEKLIAETAKTTDYLKAIEVELFGKKGLISLIRKGIPKAAPEMRKEVGRALNELANIYESAFREVSDRLTAEEKRARLSAERVDVTMPGRRPRLGHAHPIATITDEVAAIFQGMGFAVAEGPEVELDYYNFETLNMPKDHPARDMQDTFYVSDEVLLRTHTSPVQVRVMKNKKPPIQIIAPGKVYRCDADVTHTPMFHQVEGLMVDKGINFGHLKGVLDVFVTQMFGAGTATRFRPSFFPFTEPSAEVDIQCVICGGSGCRVCKTTGWLEIMGAGMVDPEVFKAVGYDPEEYSGFAFGMGIERIAMLKYGIDDIRLYYENDYRFLRQF
ncbi:MAG: phenylalanine--tRNA ligase subunit alpha [Nitrospirae bacterium]|nr:phenylalanine--tRNA ligase subunit alpha [Nitrospirota bacterium]